MAQVKIIENVDLESYAFGNLHFTTNCTVMSGKLRSRVTELNNEAKGTGDKIDEKHASAIEAQTIIKKHTLKLSINMVRTDWKEFFYRSMRSTSIIVELQNSLFRDMGDDAIAELVSGKEVPKKEENPFWCKGGIVHVDYKAWINRPKATRGLSDAQKAEKQVDKIEDADELRALEAKIQAKLAAMKNA